MAQLGGPGRYTVTRLRYPAGPQACAARRIPVAFGLNTTYRDFGWTGEGYANMSVWYTARTMSRPAKAVIAAGLLAVLLVAAVPAALFVGVIMMLLGHVVGGLALFGASVLAGNMDVESAILIGVRQLHKMEIH